MTQERDVDDIRGQIHRAPLLDQIAILAANAFGFRPAQFDCISVLGQPCADHPRASSFQIEIPECDDGFLHLHHDTGYHGAVRIIYVTHTRFPTEKAHGNQVAQVCHALTQLGHQVTLLAPTVRNVITEDPHRYYGLPQSFDVVYPGSFDALGSPFIPGKLAFMVGMWSYRRSLKKYLRDHTADLLYVRSPSILRPLLKTGLPVMLELHTLPRWGLRQFVRDCNRCFKIICLTYPMRAAMEVLGVDPVRMMTEGDAVDLTRFENLPDLATAKEAQGLPLDRVVVGYVGSLLARNTLEKGVGELVDALAILKYRGAKVTGFIVGGPREARERYEARARKENLQADDIVFKDRVPANEVSNMIAACDICVYPAPETVNRFFMRDTSPLKLFEYLAAGKSIVCSDLPPIRDVANSKCVRFCLPGDTQDLADQIEWMIAYPAEAAELAKNGKERVQKHSWTERMKRIVGRFGASET